MRKTSAARTMMTLNGVAGRVALRKVVLVLMALSSLLALPPVPAAADHAPTPAGIEAGGGRLEGTEIVQNEGFLGHPCFRVSKSVFGLQGAGTYHGWTETGQVVYEATIGDNQTVYEHGPLQIEVENTEAYYHGPYGTHGTADPSCSYSTSWTPVPAEFRIFAAGHVYTLDENSEQAPCTGEGEFARGSMDNENNWWAEWALTEDCVVVAQVDGEDVTGVVPVGTAHTHHGRHAGCFDPPCVDNFKVDYVQYLVEPGPRLTMTGPGSAKYASGAGEPVTVTARLTDAGEPVADVPVEFTVTGPGQATPPTGSGVTGQDGRTTFTFATEGADGAYTVTASAEHAGEARSVTHTVQWVKPHLELTGYEWGQIDENETVHLLAMHAADPVNGLTVNFSVQGPGQATPATGTGITGTQNSQFVVPFPDGRTSFTFSADAVGHYTVIASATYLGEEVSATHILELGARTFHRVDGLAFSRSDGTRLRSTVIDPAGRYAYYGTQTWPGRVVKVDLATFQRVGSITLQPGEDEPHSAVMDPAGRYAYFATTTDPVRVVKVDLATFERVDAITFEPGEGVDSLHEPDAVIDPEGRYAYFGTVTSPDEFLSPGRVVKVDLATFQRVGGVTFNSDENNPSVAAIDPAGEYAYFTARPEGSGPGKVVRIDLATFQRVSALHVQAPNSRFPATATIDPAGTYAYISYPGELHKLDLAAFRPVDVLALPESSIESAVIDPAGAYLYYGTDVGSTQTPVVKIDLATFQRGTAITLPEGEHQLHTVALAPDGGHAYFGARQFGDFTEPSVAKVVKVALTPPSGALVAGDDAYATDYRTVLSVPAPGVLGNDSDTEAGEALTAHLVRSPAGGRVALERDGSFVYTPDRGFSGTDTFAYTARTDRDYSAPAIVTVEVTKPLGPQGLAFNYSTDVSLFGGPSEKRGYGQPVDAPAEGLSPSVECPDGGGPSSAADGDGARGVYGPAVIFSGIWPDNQSTAPPSGPLTSDIDCADDRVSASTSQTLMPAGSTWTTPGGRVESHPGGAGPGPFIAEEVHSSCTITPDGVSSDVSIINGILETRYDEGTGEVAETEEVPDHPPANYTREGTIDHVGDRYRIVFNEQLTHADGSFTVNAVHMYLLGPTAVGDMVIGSSTCGPLPTIVQPPPKGAVADFDGDGDSDLGVFRPATGAWHVQGQTTTFHGRQGDVAVPGDYDGDGTADIAVFRPSNGGWYLAGQPTVFHGRQGDLAVPGDYDGDGAIDIGVFRPSTGGWYITGQPTVFHGRDGDVAVPGDYDGDGGLELAVFRPSTGGWYLAGQSTVFHGRDGDVPVPGDYDGDGTTDIAVFRPATGGWYLAGQSTVFHGRDGDVPVPGDYDGDGTADIAVFRPSTGGWYIQGQTTLFHGRDGDVPLPLAPAIHQSAYPPTS